MSVKYLTYLVDVFLVLSLGLCAEADSTSTDIANITSTTASPADSGYEFESRTGSWYKFHTEGLTWSNANRSCVAEGAHLAIVNSALEARVLNDLHQKYIGSVRAQWTYWAAVGVYREPTTTAGFWGPEPTGRWLTVEGQTLDQAGFSRWYSGHPWNYLDTGFGFLCFGTLSSFDDGHRAPYICEK